MKMRMVMSSNNSHVVEEGSSPAHEDGDGGSLVLEARCKSWA